MTRNFFQEVLRAFGCWIPNFKLWPLGYVKAFKGFPAALFAEQQIAFTCELACHVDDSYDT